MNKDIVKGSVLDIAMSEGKSLAQALTDVGAVVVVDTSGSMAAHDARDGQKRYDVACEELCKLQGDLPGRIAVIAFSSMAELIPGGRPPFYGEDTNLAMALQLAKTLDHPGQQTIIISDGMPNDQDKAIQEARRFKGELDAIYVGPEGGRGAAFLQNLTTQKEGRYLEAHRTDRLLDSTRLLLEVRK